MYILYRQLYTICALADYSKIYKLYYIVMSCNNRSANRADDCAADLVFGEQCSIVVYLFYGSAVNSDSAKFANVVCGAGEWGTWGILYVALIKSVVLSCLANRTET